MVLLLTLGCASLNELHGPSTQTVKFENNVLVVDLETMSAKDALDRLQAALRVPILATIDVDLSREVTARFSQEGLRTGLERSLKAFGFNNYFVDGKGDSILRVIISRNQDGSPRDTGPWTPTPFPSTETEEWLKQRPTK